MLERLELVAERNPGEAGLDDLGTVELDLLDQLANGPKPARDLAAPEGRAGLLRRLRTLEGRGAISLDWTLLAASAGPRYERWIDPHARGHAPRRRRWTPGAASAGRPLGPRQVALLTELAGHAHHGRGRSGRGRVASRAPSSRCATVNRRSRGWSGAACCSSEIRERPRRPLAGRPAGRRGGRPPATDLTPAQVTALETILTALASGDARPLLLDGVTGGGKTAIYVEAIAVGPRRRAARPRPRARDLVGAAAGRSSPRRPRRPDRVGPFRSRRRRTRRRVATDPGRRCRHRRRHATRGPRPAARTSASSSWTRSTRPPTRATGRRGSRLATPPSSWPARPGRPSCSDRRPRPWTASASRVPAGTAASCCRDGRLAVCRR